MRKNQSETPRFSPEPKKIIFNLLGAFILAFGLYNIHSVSEITEGGVLGLSLLLDYHFGVSPSVSSFILTALCYLLGTKALGADFIFCSVFACGGFSLFYALCELFPPIYPRIAGYPALAAIIGALFVGVGAGICVKNGGAPSGDDALAMSLSHLTKADIRVIYLVSDLAVLTLSLSYIPLRKIAWSFVTVILSGTIIGLITKKKK